MLTEKIMHSCIITLLGEVCCLHSLHNIKPPNSCKVVLILLNLVLVSFCLCVQPIHFDVLGSTGLSLCNNFTSDWSAAGGEPKGRGCGVPLQIASDNWWNAGRQSGEEQGSHGRLLQPLRPPGHPPQAGVPPQVHGAGGKLSARSIHTSLD